MSKYKGNFDINNIDRYLREIGQKIIYREKLEAAENLAKNIIQNISSDSNLQPELAVHPGVRYQILLSRIFALHMLYKHFETLEFALYVSNGIRAILSIFYGEESLTVLISLVDLMRSLMSKLKVDHFSETLTSILSKLALSFSQTELKYGSYIYPKTNLKFYETTITLIELSEVVESNLKNEKIEGIFTYTINEILKELESDPERTQEYSKILSQSLTSKKFVSIEKLAVASFKLDETLTSEQFIDIVCRKFDGRASPYNENSINLSRNSRNTMANLVMSPSEVIKDTLMLAGLLSILRINILDFFNYLDDYQTIKEANILRDQIGRLGDSSDFDSLESLLKDLEKLYSKSRCIELAEIYAATLFNIQLDYTRTNQNDKFLRILDPLRSIYDEFQNTSILHSLVKALKLVIHWNSVRGFLLENTNYIDELERIFDSTNDELVQTRYVEVLFHSLNGSIKENDKDLVYQFYQKIYDLNKMTLIHTSSKLIADGYANITAFFGKIEDFELLHSSILELENLSLKYKDVEFQTPLAFGLWHGIKYGSGKQKIEQTQEYVEKLYNLSEKCKNQKIQFSLAMAYHCIGSLHGFLGEFDEVQDYIERMDNLVQKNNNLDMQHQKAKLLHDAIYTYSRMDDLERMNKTIEQFEIFVLEVSLRPIVLEYKSILSKSLDYLKEKQQDKLVKEWRKKLKKIEKMR